MLKWLSSIFFLLSANLVNAQSWQWTILSPMPFPTSNNAVCAVEVNGSEQVYSFGGIDTTKIYSGIHKRCFRYDAALDTWSEIDTLPDALPKIASAASAVKGKVYIIGGYTVSSTGNETSSNRVHIYNPISEAFESDGATLPFPIDDHVQCVWRDSLIFVVTGWSNTGNVPKVQIYDPALNQWTAGTSTPSNAFFTAFGASGSIIGDTLYYFGGASGGSFGARRYMRKGYINPNDPTDITWTLMDDAPGDPSYRAACSSVENTIFWVGGSAVSYNYDGIAYDGSGGVSPATRILHFNNAVYQYADEINEPFGVMDLRGIAKLNNNRWIICGGMDSNQVVRPRTFLLENVSVGLPSPELNTWKITDTGDALQIQSPQIAEAYLMTVSGEVIHRFTASGEFTLSKTNFPVGVYFFVQDEKSIRLRF